MCEEQAVQQLHQMSVRHRVEEIKRRLAAFTPASGRVVRDDADAASALKAERMRVGKMKKDVERTRKQNLKGDSAGMQSHNCQIFHRKLHIHERRGAYEKGVEAEEKKHKARSNNEWDTDGTLRVTFTRAKATAMSHVLPGISVDQIKNARAASIASLLDHQETKMKQILRRLQDKIRMLRAQRLGYRHPCLAVEVCSDGTPLTLWCSEEDGLGKRGSHSLPVEVILRQLGWPGGRGVERLDVPLVVLPLILEANDGPTLLRAIEMSDPFKKEEVDFDLFKVVWLIVDIDAHSANRSYVKLLAAKYDVPGCGNVIVVWALCCGHQLHLSAKPLYNKSCAVSPMFGLVKMCKQAVYKMRIIEAIRQLVRDRFRVLPGQPVPEHRQRAARLLDATYLRQSRRTVSEQSDDLGPAASDARARRTWRRKGIAEEILDVASMPWGWQGSPGHVCPGESCPIKCGGNSLYAGHRFADALLEMLFGEAWMVPSENKWCDFSELLGTKELLHVPYGVGAEGVRLGLSKLDAKARKDGVWGSVLEDDSLQVGNQKRARGVCGHLSSPDSGLRSCSASLVCQAGDRFMGWLLRGTSKKAELCSGYEDSSKEDEEGPCLFGVDPEESGDDEDGDAAGLDPAALVSGSDDEGQEEDDETMGVSDYSEETDTEDERPAGDDEVADAKYEGPVRANL